MASSKVFLLLVLLPVFAFCYKCAVSDSSQNNGVSECTAQSYCVTIDEYNNNGNWNKETRSCDNNNQCAYAGKRSTYNQFDNTMTTYDCCSGDYCNSSMTKGLLAVPIMILAFLFK